jgi:hypothetical protein
MPRPAYLDVETEGAGPWGGSWTRSPPSYGTPRAARTQRAAQPPRAATPGQITVHYDDEGPSDELGLRVGAKLVHPSFGVGEVRAWQAAGADLKVTLRFPKAGVKTIYARFLRRP